MNSWTIGKRLAIGFGTVLVITVALGVFAYLELAEIRRRADNVVVDSLPGVYTIGQIQANTKDSYLAVVQQMSTTDEADAQRLMARTVEATKRNDALFAAYEKTITRDRDRELFEAVKTARADFVKVRDEFESLVRAAKQYEALTLMEERLQPVYDRYMAAISASVDDNKQFGDIAADAIDAATSAATIGILVGVVASLLVGCGVAFFIVRATNALLLKSVAELAEGAQQVTSAATQVAGSSQSLSQGATEQAASLEETSASMEEMASMTRKNAENSHQAASMVAETERLVQGANSALGEMVTSMTAIKESSDKVSKIIKTIDEIAFQTNILALNAAVEAARAGEAGMGFAVVADEVRALAQRSAQAAKDTAALIEESISRSNEGQQKVLQVTGAISSITDSTVKVKGLIDEVSVASRQQSQGIDQVSQAVAQMEKVTQTTAATAEESAAASEELSAQAEVSMHVVTQLAALIGGASTTRGSERRPKTKTAAPSPRPADAKVVAMTRPDKPGRSAKRSPEDEIPLGDTGTYASF